MQITRKINVDIKRTVENSVAGREEFHFYVDELTQNGIMPTYAGESDDKYAFEDMNDEFFEYLERKAAENGIYIRLVFACRIDSGENGAAFDLEYGKSKETFTTDERDRILEFEFADFGVKVQNGTATFGTTVEGGCAQTPYFAEFGSDKANEEFLSLENPLNLRVISIMEKMIFSDGL